MADFYPLITQQSATSWLQHPDADRFQEYLDTAHKHLAKIGRDHKRVVLCDVHPVRFLASFAAIHTSGHSVFLCNPNWAQREWQQVQAIVHPQAVFGDTALPTATTEISSSHIGPLAPSDRPLICIPTGGTSGQLKFACHTWSTLSCAALALRQHLGSSPLHSFCLLPLFHVSGFMQFVRSLLTGGNLFIGQSQLFLAGEYGGVSPANWCISLVPTQLKRALDNPELVVWLAKCRAIFLGGAPAWRSLLDSARQLHLPLAPTYGATETAAQVATLRPQAFLGGLQDCADPLPHVSINILDADGHALPANQVGHIAIQSSSLALGYVSTCSSFSDSLGAAGWIPDDIGYLDAGGRLHVLGRNSDTIMTGGENVFPAEVEAAIRDTQLVEDVAVLGMPDKEWGEVVTAVCVLGSNRLEHSADATASQRTWYILEQITIRLTSQLARYKHPKRWLATDALPRNQRGKIDRPQLRHMAVHASKL